jgi:hypothetical protein
MDPATLALLRTVFEVSVRFTSRLACIDKAVAAAVSSLSYKFSSSVLRGGALRSHPLAPGGATCPACFVTDNVHKG